MDKRVLCDSCTSQNVCRYTEDFKSNVSRIDCSCCKVTCEFYYPIRNHKSGASNNREVIKNWRDRYPGGHKIDCHKETGISRPTIDKYWED